MRPTTGRRYGFSTGPIVRVGTFRAYHAAVSHPEPYGQTFGPIPSPAPIFIFLNRVPTPAFAQDTAMRIAVG